jgi:hypothetical protein
MKVAKYRDLIDTVNYWRVSAVSAVGTHERRTEALRLQRAVEELQTARCQTASAYDRQRAERALANAGQLLAQMHEQFQAEDALITRLAFAGEWK